PNMALLAWLERQTGRKALELNHDEEGEQPWDEIRALIKNVCSMLDLKIAPERREGDGSAASSEQATADPSAIDLSAFVDPAALELDAVPKADERIDRPALHRSAVLGLFPMANQGLLADTQAMIEAQALQGPVLSFIDSRVRLEAAARDQAVVDEEASKD